MSQNKNSQGLKLALAGVAAAAIATGSGIAFWGARTPETALQPPVESPAEVVEAEGTPTESDDPDFLGREEPDSPAPIANKTANSIGDPADVPADTPVDTVTAARPDSGAASDRTGPSVYWIGTDENQVQYDAQRVAVAPNAGAETQLRTAMGELLAGSEATAIPSGTELLGAEVRGQDVYVDLSNKFTEGGGSAAMAARLGQVIYTATAIEPGAQVWISVEGEPLTELGGEGLLIDQPLNVAKFEQDFNF